MKRNEFTIINGSQYTFLECAYRFERPDQTGSHWFIDGSCKRVALSQVPMQMTPATYVEQLAPNHFSIGDATIIVDTDGEEWLQTDLGKNCPRCLAVQAPASLRVIETKNVNPFTGAAFDDTTMEDGPNVHAELIEGLGRALTVNSELVAQAEADFLQYGIKSDEDSDEQS